MQSGPDVLCEQNVPSDERLLGHRGPARETQFRAEGALVHLSAFGESRILRVLGDDAAERRDVLEGTTHEQGIRHALAVVAEDPHRGPTLCHGPDLAQPLTREPYRDGANGANGHVAVLLPQRGDLLDDARGVGHWRGVGHGVHRGKAPGRRRP